MVTIAGSSSCVAGFTQVLHTIGMKIYERLSQVYDIDWGRFAERYLILINQLVDEHHIGRARVLDIACGTGILAISLARLGHTVLGIDISSDMLAAAKSKSMDVPNASFEVQDMTGFAVSGKFDIITCTFDSLNYVLDIRGVEAMFVRVARALKRPGLFIFDSNTHQHYLSVGNGSQERKLDGRSFVQKWSYNPIKKEATTVFKFADGSKEIHRQRPYDLSQLSPLLIGSGLRPIETWSSFDRNPYDARSARLFCLAKKRV